MQRPTDSRYQLALKQAVRETLLLSVVFLLALALFFATFYFIAAKEVDQDLQKRPRGIILGWLTIITIGLILGRTRQQEDGVVLPKSLVIVRESLQAIMLLLFFCVLAYGSYFLYTSRKLILQRPWGIMVGWFAFLMFIAFFAKTSAVIRFARRK